MNGTTIECKMGTEGPKHDPYSYEEWTITRLGHSVTVHSGLGEWAKIDGGPLQDIPALILGFPLALYQKAYHKWSNKCHHCGSRYLRDESGFPGETLYICARCDKISHTHFNESDVI